MGGGTSSRHATQGGLCCLVGAEDAEGRNDGVCQELAAGMTRLERVGAFTLACGACS
jgi:hypothetical protein